MGFSESDRVRGFRQRAFTSVAKRILRRYGTKQ
jgi:hypothetical protein